MKKILGLLFLISLGLNAQNASVVWSNQKIQSFYEEGSEKYRFAKKVLYENKKQLLLFYVSMKSVMIKGINLSDGNIVLSEKFEPTIGGLEEDYTPEFSIIEDILIMEKKYKDGTRKKKVIFVELISFKEIQNEKMLSQFSDKNLNPNIPFAPFVAGHVWFDKETKLKSKKITFTNDTYSIKDSKRKVFFENYNEIGNKIILKFSIVDNGTKLLTDEMIIESDINLRLQEIIEDKNEKIAFLFLEVDYEQVNKKMFHQISTGTYIVTTFDITTKLFFTHKFENMKSEFRSKLSSNGYIFDFDLKKENIYLASFLQDEKKIKEIKFINNIINIKSKTNTSILSTITDEKFIDEIKNSENLILRIIGDNNDALYLTYEDVIAGNMISVPSYNTISKWTYDYAPGKSNTIFIVRIGKTGTIISQNIYYKRQSQGSYLNQFNKFSTYGYSFFTNNNKVNYILNSTIRDENTVSDKEYLPICFYIDDNGIVKRSKIDNFKNSDNSYLVPEFTHNIKDGVVLIAGTNNIEVGLEDKMPFAITFGILTVK